MNFTTLSNLTHGQDWIGLGIAGNQAEHLNQAGEADDFKEVVALENAPKGIFPWHIPGYPSFLGTNPLSNNRLSHNGEAYLQPEPEIGLVVKFHYAEESNALLRDVSVLGFSAFNDCSRRVNAPKISIKKNWGPATQGMSEDILPINDFTTTGGTIDNFRLACYIKRDGELLQYGKDTAVSDYCYFNQTLVDWMVNQINTQTDHGPLEPLDEMLADSKPAYGVIAIGATCYSDFGNSEQRFLRENDEIFVLAYDATHQNSKDIEQFLTSGTPQNEKETILILKQSVKTEALVTS